MWHRDTKWANKAAKWVPIDLFHTGQPQTCSLLKKKKKKTTIMQNVINWSKIKWDMLCMCVSVCKSVCVSVCILVAVSKRLWHFP